MISLPTLIGSTSTRRNGQAVVAEVRPFDLYMYDGVALDGVAARAAGFFSGVEVPVRMLALTEPFSAAPAIERVTALLGATSPQADWQRSGLAAYRTFLETLVARADLRRTRYFLVAWPGPELPPTALWRAAEDAFLTPVRQLAGGLPPFWAPRAPYREEWDHLAPEERGQPYLAVWTAWELLGTWDLTTCHQVLRMPFPLGLCVHVATLGLDQARFKLQNSYNALTAQLTGSGRFSTKDARSEEAFRDVQRAMQVVEEGERFHLVSLALLVKAPTLARLREHGAYLKNALAARLRLRLEVGQQQEALKLFTAAPLGQVRLDLRSAPTLSGGAGLLMPFGFRSRAETGGILWGVDRTTENPVFYDGWGRSTGEGGQPFHLTILGRPGSGKTFALNVLLHRLALTGTQVILIEPQGHCRRLAESLGPGASYHRIALGQATINVLDQVEYTLAAQITHVNRQLALLLSSGTGAASAGSDLGRRVFSNAELAALTAAQQQLYAPSWDTSAPLSADAAPRLADLCYYLKETEGGTALAAEIDALYVRSELGRTFNQPTNLDLSLAARAICFDVSRVDETYRPWFYAQILAALTRHIRNPRRGYPVVLAVDEFKYLAADPVLAKLVVDLNKTARTFQAAIWTADQNPSSYTMNEQTQQIIANTPLVLIGKQQARDVTLDKELFPRLTDVHITQITTAKRGEFVAILDDEYYPLRIEPSPLELAYFAGT